MRVRKLSALLGATLIFGGCVVLYLIMDVSLFPAVDIQEQNKWLHFEDRLNRLEENLSRHHAVVGEIKHNIKRILGNNSSATTLRRATTTVVAQAEPVACSAMLDSVPSVDVQMLEVYKQLKFEDLDGGVWKQGWNLEYEAGQWNRNNKLQVYVVPHSHNDPGWVKTFEDYYRGQTRNILNNMVVKLKEDARRRFVWAEMSYLALWWDEITPEVKEDVRRLASSGQLEIVTGGWVMPDEANTHYSSVINQLLEGHLWLRDTLRVKPSSSWSIDPFGQSPALPFILRRAGLDNLVLQRVHYSVKKRLARDKNLEFRWRQAWDGSGDTDLLTHLMPFYSYDVPHTCGPDPKVCCQFDFRRLPGYGMACPWKVSPQVITKKNVAYRAELLLDQYRKKAQLYRTGVVMVPLGDDFRYDHASEWDAQFDNYQRIFDYLNGNQNLHVQIQFGTVSDFFGALRSEMSASNFPTLSGDFFTYADREDHYWSGYYSSRPFYKRMDRVLLSYLRSAEMLFALAVGGRQHSDWLLAPEWGLTKLLSDARQAHALFQHHDGITGTARDHVVEDYARKMWEALKGSQHVIQQAAHFLLSPDPERYEPAPERVYFQLDDSRRHHYSLPEPRHLLLGRDEPRAVVLFNSLASARRELVTLRVSTPQCKVTNASGTVVPSQSSPVFLHSTLYGSTVYDVTFYADVPALGLATYHVEASTLSDKQRGNTYSTVEVWNLPGDLPAVPGFDISRVSEPRAFTVGGARVTATFSPVGLLKAVRRGDTVQPVHLDFARYTARPGAERSGAYLFLPDGEAVAVPVGEPVVTVSRGPLVSTVQVRLPGVVHTVSVPAESDGLHVRNLVDVGTQENSELAMRLSTTLKNADTFYTDLNGLHILRRKRFPKLPIQGNYYPLPALAFIQDARARLTLVAGQPQGVASLKEGQIEVMQDRRLNQDDNRGLGQGVTDNLPTVMAYTILFETRTVGCQGVAPDHPSGLPSLAAHLASSSLLHPLLPLHWTSPDPLPSPTNPPPASLSLPPTLHVVLLRAFPPPSPHRAGLIVHRSQVDTCFPTASSDSTLDAETLNIGQLLPTQFGETITRSSLTFMHDLNAGGSKRRPVAICPMDVAAFTFPR